MSLVASMRARARDFAYRHVGGTALVLVYHRVTELERDPQLLAVTPGNFDAQMTLLAKRYSVLPLPELAAGIGSHHVPDRAVAVTFDDGYADNLLEATPPLERHGVPATVFVSSGYVESGREFWWDEVERIVLGPGTLPETVALETPEASFSYHLEGQLERTAEVAERDRAWNLLLPDAGPRHNLYRKLCDFYRPLAPVNRLSALAQLRQAAYADDEPRATHRPLTAEDVTRLDSSPFVEVGAHTVNHPVLSARSADEQRIEIGCDKEALEELCGRPITWFSYPYGKLSDYTHETVSIVREGGFSGACSNHLGVVKPWTDVHRLPRVIVRDLEASEFAGLLEGWFRAPR